MPPHFDHERPAGASPVTGIELTAQHCLTKWHVPCGDGWWCYNRAASATGSWCVRTLNPGWPFVTDIQTGAIQPGEDDDEDGGDPESNTEARSDDNRTSELPPGTAAAIFGGGGQSLQRDSGGECEDREFWKYRNRRGRVEEYDKLGRRKENVTDGGGVCGWGGWKLSVGRDSEDAIARDSREGLLMQDPREDEEPGPEVQENPANAGGTMYSFVPGQQDILSMSNTDRSTEGVTGILRGMLGGPEAEG
ncbi:hypothetical protein BDZ91DRAFT_814648 [Kalaharituber pfeilii]|nr:hypothetical protein BDZ91DRAFT_814648 [Kalaharituber pfeilii]